MTLTNPEEESIRVFRTPLVLLSIGLGIFIYTYRSVIRFYDECSLLFIAIIVFSIFFLIFAFIRLTIARHPTQFIIILSIIFLFVFAPRIIPEKFHLMLHRTDYNKVIEMARDQELGHEGICQYAFVLPDEYKYLTFRKDKCIFVEQEPALVVVFEPLFYRNLLVYAETEQALNAYISCGGSDGFISDKVEKHWYICRQDWN